MPWIHGPINGGTFIHTDAGDIEIKGDIDSGANVTLTSTTGSIVISGKVDEGSTVNLTALGGAITISTFNPPDETNFDPGDSKIDGGSRVTVHAGADITLLSKIDHGSLVTMVSDNGSITIGGKIDGISNVTLTATGDIGIGAFAQGGDAKIDGQSNVSAQAAGSIKLGNKIDGGSVVDFKACGTIKIEDKIDGGSLVRLAAQNAINIGNPISDGGIGGGGTNVTYWLPDILKVAGKIDADAVVTDANWVPDFKWCPLPPITGGPGPIREPGPGLIREPGQSGSAGTTPGRKP